MSSNENLLETGEINTESGKAFIVLGKMENQDGLSNRGSTQSLTQETTLTSTPIKNDDAPILHLEVPEIEGEEDEILSQSSTGAEIPSILITPEADPIEPEDVKVPILGYDVMEARSKFTVYKIEVERSGFDRWFVFRRYNDFYQLNDKLKKLFPNFRLSLPPRRWFRSNYDRDFLEERTLGLQAFLNNITGHKDICNCKEVREFFCFDDPPGPHDSLEESRALCENLEETIYVLRRDLDEKTEEIDILHDEIQLYKSQVEILTKELKEKKRDPSFVAMSPISNQISLAECDQVTSGTESDQSCSSTDGKLGKEEKRVHFPSSEHEDTETSTGT